ncbi:MAG: CDP-glycerol glycerophosphotransferase family protein [Alkalimonas sp.]|nr:CDP-glycerol glycerophosphotransferase family protein [Alkalimonas sp.]
MNDEAWIIFGASKRGETAIAAAPHRKWFGFIDNDPCKWGSLFCGLPVMSLDQYLKSYATLPIVIASQYQMEIVEQLLEHGVQRFELFWPVFRSKLDEVDTTEDFQLFDLEGSSGVRQGRLALFISNNSGSNTFALKKMCSLDGAGVDAVFHHDMLKSHEYIEDLLRSDAVVITHDKILRSDVKTIQLWHGFPLKGLNYMSRYQPESTRKVTHQRWLKYAAVASYSATYTSLMNACYGIQAEQYVVTGMPRNDLLFSVGASNKLEKVMGKKLKGRRVVLYMPTFRKTMYGQVNGEENISIFGFKSVDREALFKFLDEHKLVLVVKPHPYHEDDFGLGHKETLPENIWVITDSPLIEHDFDFYEILSASDLLITDYSSVYFDYLLLDKPIIFTPTDSEAYRETRGFLLEPYDFWAPGPKCFDQASLQQEILKQIDMPYKYAKERENITQIVHHFRDNESSARVAKLIVDKLNAN